LIVQFWEPGKKPECKIHSLIDCSSSQDAASIFDLIFEALLNKSYGNNLVAVATDGAAVLRGRKNSVVQRLREKYKKIWDLHCISHCFNLLANYACKALPDFVENFVRLIYNYFSHSASRTKQWLDLQDEMNIKPHKILSFGVTRWSSLYVAVARILDKWESLNSYFENQGNDDSKLILQNLKDPEIIVSLQFLKSS